MARRARRGTWAGAAALVAALAIAWLSGGPGEADRSRRGGVAQEPAAMPSAAGAAALERWYAERVSGEVVEASGRVRAILPDDREGSRHQRFILELDGGLTLLVSHNVDLAPRVAKLARGDRVAFRGQYEWNPEGGVIHWTHRDPAGRRPGGWLRHRGATYR